MCKLFGKTLKTNVYVDGFNLYYGAVKDTPYKWLDLATFCQNLFPKKNISKIKYFSARVKASRHDPNAPTRRAEAIGGIILIGIGLRILLAHIL